MCSRLKACRPCKHVSLFVEMVVELFACFSFLHNQVDQHGRFPTGPGVFLSSCVFLFAG